MEMLGELMMGSSAHPLNVHQNQAAFKIRGPFTLRASLLKMRSHCNSASAAVSVPSESSGPRTTHDISENLRSWSSYCNRDHLALNKMPNFWVAEVDCLAST